MALTPEQVANMIESGPQRIVEKMGVAEGRLHLRMPEPLSDHRQGHAAADEH